MDVCMRPLSQIVRHSLIYTHIIRYSLNTTLVGRSLPSVPDLDSRPLWLPRCAGIMAAKWSFKAQPGVFVELTDIAHEYPGEKVTTQPNLGLISGQSYPSDDPDASDQRDWVRLARYVRWLNENSSNNVAYKIVYLTRHGLGVHNKMHAQVGSEAWNTRVSFENGDGKETWFDAFLTEVGEQQAQDLKNFWTDLIKVQGAPLPQTFYTSPLARCLQTTDLVFSSLMATQTPPLQPIVKELLRERITRHTCDYRRPRTWIAENYPTYQIEDGFEEEDQFTNRVDPETDEEHVVRKQRALEDIFNETPKECQFISLTVHSYAIRAIQGAVGAGVCRTREGTSIALLVRGERDVDTDGTDGLDINDYTSADPEAVSSLRRFSM